MKALVLRQFGDPDELRVEEVPQPQARDGDVLVKVLAAGINPSDVRNVQGFMAGTTLPRIPGRDFAGVVIGGPSDLQDREVWGTGGDVGFTRDGSHAEYILIPATAVVEKPVTLSMESAGAAGLTFVTAWSALVTNAAIEASDTALIVGAAGGVGSAAVQIAEFLCATVIAAVRDRNQVEPARQAGASQVIVTGTKSLADEVRAQTGGRGATVVFDSTGHFFAEGIESAAHGARVCVISAPPDGAVTFNLRSLYRKELKVFGVDTRALDVTACSKLLTAMAQGFNEGRLRSGAPHTYPLERAREAYAQALRSTGRYCLTPRV